MRFFPKRRRRPRHLDRDEYEAEPPAEILIRRHRSRRREGNTDDSLAPRTTITSNDNNMNIGVHGVDHPAIDYRLESNENRGKINVRGVPLVAQAMMLDDRPNLHPLVAHNNDDVQFTRAIESVTAAILIVPIVIACIGLNGFVFAIFVVAPLFDRSVTTIVALVSSFTVGIFGTGFVVAKRVLNALLSKEGNIPRPVQI